MLVVDVKLGTDWHPLHYHNGCNRIHHLICITTLGPVDNVTPVRPSELENLHLYARLFTESSWLWDTTYIK